ncbi:MAG: tryptophanase [Candidatus Zixiibacteriota bacterium]
MNSEFDFPVEPYRIKVIEPIRLLPRDKREEVIRQASFNIFNIAARDVFIDLLTDSGTSAMSDDQWAGMMKGDESYAGCNNYYHFVESIQDIFGFKHVMPVHQGRVAENLLFSVTLKDGDFVPNNTHFDTTRANTMHKGGQPVDLIIKEGKDPSSLHPFKGNMDIAALEDFIIEKGKEKIPLIIMTITNNTAAGQPVSMDNIRKTSDICKKYSIPFFFDAARFAENCWFIKQREEGYRDREPIEIAREMFSYADGCVMSAKKDGLVNMGGFIALNDDELEQKITKLMILIEGFRTYGGLAGRDLEAVARGLRESLDPDYLDFRTAQVKFLGDRLVEKGVPIIQPPGGHAIFVDAGAMFPHIPASDYPGQTLTVALYREGGIRGVEIGGLMFAEKDPVTGEEISPPLELVRLAIPRRVYTNSHLDYVAHVCGKINSYKEKLHGFEIVYQTKYLRHFTMKLKEKNSSSTVDVKS